ncbi:MAG TPA: hypothetical protein VFZ72_01755 [Jiangellaceae bacterium]
MPEEPTREEKALREFLEREGVDVEGLIDEKRKLMERKQMHGRRVELAVRTAFMPPMYVEVEGEERR